MRFVLVLLLFFSTTVHAQKQLGRDVFMINVRPVLNGILSDFYQMLGQFPDFPKEIIPVIEEMDNLTADKEILRTTCPRLITVKCKEQITSIRTKLQKLKSLSFLLVSRQNATPTLHINLLAGQRIVSEFDGELEKVKGLLDNIALVMSAGIPQKRETYYFLKKLDELNPLISLAIVEYIPFMYQEDFRHFYFNFVQPIQRQISKNSNYEFVNKNINSLNFTINLLNMTLTKKKKTPQGMGPYLNTIHNRWNSILRYYY